MRANLCNKPANRWEDTDESKGDTRVNNSRIAAIRPQAYQCVAKK